MNNAEKKLAERLYNTYLNKIISKIGNKETSESELDNLGKKLFGNKFNGVFALDDKYNLKNGFYIINNNTRLTGGEHWQSVFVDNGKFLVYDSFARDKEMKKIMKGKRYISTEKDVEQKMSESNCGQRCIAFLMVCYVGGMKLGRWI